MKFRIQMKIIRNMNFVITEDHLLTSMIIKSPLIMIKIMIHSCIPHHMQQHHLFVKIKTVDEFWCLRVQTLLQLSEARASRGWGSCPLVGVLSCLGIAALPGPALEWPSPASAASVGQYSTQCHSVKIINKCNKMGKKKTGCNFRIRSPYVREFLAETIGWILIKRWNFYFLKLCELLLKYCVQNFQTFGMHLICKVKLYN